jgi:hypothetical protein
LPEIGVEMKMLYQSGDSDVYLGLEASSKMEREMTLVM